MTIVAVPCSHIILQKSGIEEGTGPGGNIYTDVYILSHHLLMVFVISYSRAKLNVKGSDWKSCYC